MPTPLNHPLQKNLRLLSITGKDVDRILQNLMLASGQKIVPEKTLIIFDEVQDCPKVINSMKYFCENAPQYHIACAGSLLGIALAKPSSFPVGKVNFMQIDPMTFTEFLLANGDENLVKYLESVETIEPISDAFFNPLYEKLKMYYVTGGMPEPVLMWMPLFMADQTDRLIGLALEQ